jgi:hypothetical protein
LRGVRLDAIYSSTLSRSRDTAVIVAGERRVQPLSALRERNSGKFERGPNDATDYLKRRFMEDDNLDGGEKPTQFARETVQSFIRDDLIAANNGFCVPRRLYVHMASVTRVSRDLSDSWTVGPFSPGIVFAPVRPISEMARDSPKQSA